MRPHVDCTCEWCGKVKQVEARDVKRGRGIVCSLRCAAQRGEYLKRGGQAYSQPVVYALCRTCGEWFVKHVGHAVYCSAECKPRHHPATGYVGPTTQPCQYCGDDFTSDHAGPRRYCCPEHRKQNKQRIHRQRMMSDPEYAAKHRLTKRARRLHLTAREWRILDATIKRLRGKCPDCGKRVKQWHIDHYHPRAAGGSDAIENLRPICGECNSKRKRAKIPNVEYLAERGDQLAIVVMP